MNVNRFLASVLRTGGLAVLLSAGSVTAARSAQALPQVVITQVEINQDSARIYYRPVPGAADYRVYALENPKEVKYAGLIHRFAPDGEHWAVGSDGQPVFPYRTEPNGDDKQGPSRLDIPELDIEMNGLDPADTVHAVIEAVDRVGPSPFSNLATEQNAPVSESARAKMRPMAGGGGAKAQVDNDSDVMELLGSNAGPTDDGLYSINGQSGPHIKPTAIARSLAIAIRPTGEPALPSTSDAQQVVFDTFGKGDISEIAGTRNEVAGDVSYTMRGDTDWRIDFLNDDIDHSRPFIMNRHYMDVLFDGGTPGTNAPLHIAHGASAVSAERTADFTGGRMLHVTMEVDGHMDGRRWMAFNLSPNNDPITNFYSFNAPIDKSGDGFFVQLFGGDITADLFVKNKDTALCGALGQAPVFSPRPSFDGYNGRGLDNRSRFDLFLSRKRYAVFENGDKIVDEAIAGAGLPASLQHVRVYFTHYLYHTANEINDLKTYSPWESFWIDLFPYSDERHWDNMGFEVLPARYAVASADTLGGLIRRSRSIRTVQAVHLMAEK